MLYVRGGEREKDVKVAGRTNEVFIPLAGNRYAGRRWQNVLVSIMFRSFSCMMTLTITYSPITYLRLAIPIFPSFPKL